MSALAERIIAARDDMKRHFASHYVLSVMADAANAIVGQEALLKAENAARLDLQNLAADECARADKMRDLLTRAREYVTDALDAHEHSDGRDLLKEIDAALEAAAPHMLSAPEGVSEAEIVRHMTHEEWRGCRIENYRWKFKIPEALQGSEWDWSYASHWSTPAAHEEAEALVSVKDAERALLSALSSERERAADYKQAFETADRLLGNAQARADQAEFLLALALECARTKAAREAAMFDLADAAEARAQAAERERDEARRGERNLSEHARKVAHEANKAFGVVEDMEKFWDACGHPSNRGHLTPAEQVSSIIRERDAAEARAQAALNTQHIPQGDRHD